MVKIRSTQVKVNLAIALIAFVGGVMVLAVVVDSALAQSPPLPEPKGAAIVDYILNASPYTTWNTWPSEGERNPADYGLFRASTSPHGATVRVFVSDRALAVLDYSGFDGSLPTGSLIVQENYAGPIDAPGDLVSLVVKYKVDDVNSASGDWFWVEAFPNGDTGNVIQAQGAVPRCIVCHQAGMESDYVLGYRLPGARPTSSAGGGDFGVALDGNSLINVRCTTCHSRDRIDTASQDRAGWQATIDRMIGYGSNVNSGERAAMIAYLVGTTGGGAPDANGVIGDYCTACHSRVVVDNATKTAAEWGATLDTHAALGVEPTAAEREALIAYLTNRAAAPVAASVAGSPAGTLEGNALVNARCTTCHSRTVVDRANFSQAGWESTLNWHAGRGVALSAAERDALMMYLVSVSDGSGGSSGDFDDDHDEHDDDHDEGDHDEHDDDDHHEDDDD